MSVKLDNVTEPSDLTDDQYTILQAQGNLPKGFPFRPDLVHNPDRPDPSATAHTGTIKVMSTEELEAELERRRAEETTPKIENNGGIVNEGEADPYEEWTNQELRAELADRDLAVTGNKEELIARLEENDSEANGDD